jgi:tRNA threonylcarbamoyladenosine biosynthesis protein TsaB
MLVLALDTALGASSAAVLDTTSGRILARASEPMERGHAERLVPLVAEVCQAAGIAPGDCRRFVATIGPGSFTGLRVAIAAARGMALAAGGDAVGVTTLAALSEPYLAAAEPVAAFAAIDARHDHVYASLMEHDRSLVAPPLYMAAAAAAQLASRAPVALVGPGADIVLGHWPAGASAPVVLDEAAFPDIAVVARLGASADPATSPCRPLYLKAVDAKPQTRSPLLARRGA